MEIKVKDCNDCPFSALFTFFGDSKNYCKIYNEGNNTLLRNDIIEDDNTDIIHPEWCPLKLETIKVSL